MDGGFREKRARAAPAREKVRAGSARASKRRSLFVQQASFLRNPTSAFASFLRNPTSAFLANKQVSCGIQQVSCGMRIALLILMAVTLLSRTGCVVCRPPVTHIHTCNHICIDWLSYVVAIPSSFGPPEPIKNNCFRFLCFCKSELLRTSGLS